MASMRTLLQLDVAVVARLDQRAASERRSRADLVREAIDRYLDDDIEAAIDRAIVAGYTRVPPVDLDGDEAVRASIAEEPWERA